MSRVSKLLLDIVEVTFISASIVILTFLFLAQPLVVTGDSMLPNFKDKEQIIAEKISIKFELPVRGEVVIVKHPDDPKTFLIKRVVGLPGETLLISGGSVFINGDIVEEPYVLNSNATTGNKMITEGNAITLNDNEFVVLGDNRKNSADSRLWGPIDKSSIVGRTALVYYPFNSFRIAQ